MIRDLPTRDTRRGMEKIRRPLIGNIGETRLSVEITKENARILYFADPESHPRLHTTDTPGPTPVRKRPFVTQPGKGGDQRIFPKSSCSHNRTHVRVSERNEQVWICQNPLRNALIRHPGSPLQCANIRSRTVEIFFLHIPVWANTT